VQQVQLPRPQLPPQPLADNTFLPAPPSLFSRLRPYSLQSETPAPTPGEVRINDVVLPPGQLARPAEPRALGSRVFSGEEINYYFDKYFEHFHPYLPIVRTRKGTCPVLGYHHDGLPPFREGRQRLSVSDRLSTARDMELCVSAPLAPAHHQLPATPGHLALPNHPVSV